MAGEELDAGRRQDRGNEPDGVIVGDGRLERLQAAAVVSLQTLLKKALDGSKDVAHSLASQRNPFPVAQGVASIAAIDCPKEDADRLRRLERSVNVFLPAPKIKECYEVLARGGTAANGESSSVRAVTFPSAARKPCASRLTSSYT